MMNEHSRKWFKPLVAVLLAGSMVMFSGCGEEEDTPAAATTKPSRDLAANQGAAEYHAGIGYGNTLLDSADKKCQGCHFELYDTWKTSMHAQSWTDKIFQSKYKEYLRLQLGNIGGVQPDSGTTYAISHLIGGGGTSSTARVASGAARVCIKCHAPSALYAGDFNITVTEIGDAGTVTTSSGATLKAETNATQIRNYLTALETNSTVTVHSSTPIKVAAVAQNGKVYTASYHIGHEANREGINCATCHSIETIRLIGGSGVEGARDGGVFNVSNGSSMTYGAHGPTRYNEANGTFTYDGNASNPQMNAFFSLVGPELYKDTNKTPRTAQEFSDAKAIAVGTSGGRASNKSEGRFTLRGIDINGTNGKTHYTGGPFYGPYGITGTNNSNSGDDTNRTALALSKDEFKAKDNHFSKHAKALCLSCHQRSAGPQDKNQGANQMELCSTWNVMSTGSDNNWLDSASSPKCTKCHMPRLDNKTVLHKWNNPNELFQRDELLTGYFDPKDGDAYGEAHNPTVGKWMNDHGFVGANKLTAEVVNKTIGKAGTNWKEKIQSGFEAVVTADKNATHLTVTTSLLNKTAHMLPGAHPMRRMLTRVIVNDGTNDVNYTSATGVSAFENIVNTVVPSEPGSVVNKTGTGRGSVGVEYDASRVIQISGLQPDLNGSAVSNQKFDMSDVNVTNAADVIGSIVDIDDSNRTIAQIKNARIVDSTDTSKFTRIYGRETASMVGGVPVTRPGFGSNTVRFDNRLVPNEKETYTIIYPVESGKTYTVTYKVYYMLTGANGNMGTIEGATFANTDEVFAATVTK